MRGALAIACLWFPAAHARPHDRAGPEVSVLRDQAPSTVGRPAAGTADAEVEAERAGALAGSMPICPDRAPADGVRVDPAGAAPDADERVDASLEQAGLEEEERRARAPEGRRAGRGTAPGPAAALLAWSPRNRDGTGARSAATSSMKLPLLDRLIAGLRLNPYLVLSRPGRSGGLTPAVPAGLAFGREFR